MSLKPTSPNPNWPRLTERGRHTKAPYICQWCGTWGARDKDIRGWQEHDHNDQPEYKIVFLCTKCSKELIEPHVRLYRQIPVNEPVPGSMEICDGCKWQKEIYCTNPAAKVNGGPGINYDIPAPSVAFYDGRGKDGKRTGWRELHYSEPAKGCSGKETKT